MQNSRRTFTRSLILVVGLIACSLFGLLVNAVYNVHEAGCESSCVGKFSQLSLAWRNFYDLNWRFLSIECNEYGDKTLSWLKVVEAVTGFDREKLTCPSNNGVAYFVVTGPGAVVQDCYSLTEKDVEDGIENTVVFLEAATGTGNRQKTLQLRIADIGELLDKNQSLPADDVHPLGRGMLFADGTMCRQVKPLSKQQVQALMTAAGHEDVKRTDLVAEGFLTIKFPHTLDFEH